MLKEKTIRLSTGLYLSFYSGLEKKFNVLIKSIDLQEVFELHFQLLSINDNETKRNKNENFHLRLCLVEKTILSFKSHPWSNL